MNNIQNLTAPCIPQSEALVCSYPNAGSCFSHLGLFEGIGGFSLAARWMGWKTIAWCEWNEFGQKVLRHHFPDAIGHGDITKTDFTPYANTIDILTGGFPCQPYSTAGKRLGKEDDRHLWPEMLRAIREISPRWVVGENVRGLTNWNGGMVFDEVQADLEAQGYKVLPFLLPACAVNAPHRRDRIWFIAHSNHKRNSDGLGHFQGADEEIPERDNNAESGNAGDGDASDGRFIGGVQGFTKIQSKITKGAGADGISLQWDATNANGTIGRKGGMHQEGRTSATGHISPCNTRNGWNWQNFPTQPPVCSRNDGFPYKLDGLTISKHRQESIKAYGNAIVPQVAFEIYKAIEQYEKLQS